MFRGNKITAAKAANAATLGASTKPPLVTGGAAMMLKSMGIDPAQMEAVAEAFINDVSNMATRVDTIEARLTALEQSAARIEALLEKLAS